MRNTLLNLAMKMRLGQTICHQIKVENIKALAILHVSIEDGKAATFAFANCGPVYQSKIKLPRRTCPI